jgi:NAD(P)-dependent dehydrogenase (short-subunit alcohol dehydrogenase family)
MKAVYAALKAGVSHLVQSVAAEVRANGITINAVLPGTIDTPANRRAMPDADPSRWVEPIAIAKAITLLLGDDGSGVTGSLVTLPD